MHIAVIDDSTFARRLLVDFISSYCQESQLNIFLSEYESGEAFLAAAQKFRFQLIFLDIHMGGMNGIETARKIREYDEKCLLIFCSSMQSFAVESFRVRAFDYLLKPYTYEEFIEVMRLCDKAVGAKYRCIEVREGRDLVKVKVTDIYYTDYANHYIYVHTKERVIKSYTRFADIHQLLMPYPQFVNCYRNCIVNLDEVEKMDKKDFIMKNGDHVPIARRQYTNIKELYEDYIFERS